MFICKYFESQCFTSTYIGVRSSKSNTLLYKGCHENKIGMCGVPAGGRRGMVRLDGYVDGPQRSWDFRVRAAHLAMRVPVWLSNILAHDAWSVR